MFLVAEIHKNLMNWQVDKVRVDYAAIILEGKFAVKREPRVIN